MNQIKLLLIVFFFLNLGLAVGQNKSFVGKIDYICDYSHPETGEDLSDKLAPYLGTEQHYYVKEGDYKAYNEKGTLTQLYNSKSNKYYLVNPVNQSVSVFDASKKESNIIKVEMIDSQDIVIGIACNKLKIITEDSETIYWYASSVKVPYTRYSNHGIGNWGEYLKLTSGALPLKYSMENSDFIMTLTAVQIEELDLTEKDFDIETMMK